MSLILLCEMDFCLFCMFEFIVLLITVGQVTTKFPYFIILLSLKLKS